MNLTPSDKQIVCMKFDSYIKRCCKNELRNEEKYRKRICGREISITNLTEKKSEKTTDEIVVPDFVVKGYAITINNDILLSALEMLKARERELILLLFYMGYEPGDMTSELKVVERTVYNRRKKILKKLRKLMEENV